MIKGKRLREARKKLGISQKQLAEQLGLAKSTVSLYESEKRNPKLETIIELMYILGVTSDYLLGSDVVVEVKGQETNKFQPLTIEEMTFLNEIRKDKVLYEILFDEPKKGVAIIKQRIG